MTAIDKASEVINSKVDYIGGGMDGYVVLTTIDDAGYPHSVAITISKADGINWLSMLTGARSKKAMRLLKNNKAGICLATNNYNITLIGTAEVITAPDIKKEHWQDTFAKHHGPYTSEKHCVIKFTTERYNIYFAEEALFDKGVMEGITK